MGKDRQDNGLERLDRQLADGEHLAVGQNVEVCHDYLPDVVDARNIDEGCLHEPAHRKCVDLGEDLTLGRCRPSVLLSREHGGLEVFEDADSKLGQGTDQLRQALHVKEERARE